MQLVDNLDQILANIETLEHSRLSERADKAADYLNLIKRGTCFLPYLTTDGIAFAPSRFIGYVRNNFARHASNEYKNGSKTNDAIISILGQLPITDPGLEVEYKRFCTQIGITPFQKGAFGNERKFWITPDIRARLELIAEDVVIRSRDLNTTEKEQIIKARIGQGVFREALLKHWKGQCCITACSVAPVLRASHIKPWHKSTNNERLDHYNGLLLSANVDVLFDCGLISLSDEGEILRSSRISAEELESLGCLPTTRVKLDLHHAPYLAFHRAEIFR